MKKILAMASAIIAIVAIFPNTEAAGNFSDWKCSQCGATQHKAGQSPPFVSGCKVSADGKHIWFKI